MAEKNKKSTEEKLDELISDSNDKKLIETYLQFKCEVHEATMIINRKLDVIINNMKK